MICPTMTIYYKSFVIGILFRNKELLLYTRKTLPYFSSRVKKEKL